MDLFVREMLARIATVPDMLRALRDEDHCRHLFHATLRDASVDPRRERLGVNKVTMPRAPARSLLRLASAEDRFRSLVGDGPLLGPILLLLTGASFGA